MPLLPMVAIVSMIGVLNTWNSYYWVIDQVEMDPEFEGSLFLVILVMLLD